MQFHLVSERYINSRNDFHFGDLLLLPASLGSLGSGVHVLLLVCDLPLTTWVCLYEFQFTLSRAVIGRSADVQDHLFALCPSGLAGRVGAGSVSISLAGSSLTPQTFKLQWSVLLLISSSPVFTAFQLHNFKFWMPDFCATTFLTLSFAFITGISN